MKVDAGVTRVLQSPSSNNILPSSASAMFVHTVFASLDTGISNAHYRNATPLIVPLVIACLCPEVDEPPSTEISGMGVSLPLLAAFFVIYHQDHSRVDRAKATVNVSTLTHDENLHPDRTAGGH
ncbi:hypothetical protein AAFN47_26390 [Hoeflea sp. CAU 1731]